MMAFTAWIEPALARSYLNCLAKKVVIVDNPKGSTSSYVEWASGLMRRRKPSCKLDHKGRCRDDHNRVRPVRNCSRPAATLVLVYAFYPIFKLAVSRTQDEGLCAMP